MGGVVWVVGVTSEGWLCPTPLGDAQLDVIRGGWVDLGGTPDARVVRAKVTTLGVYMCHIRVPVSLPARSSYT